MAQVARFSGKSPSDWNINIFICLIKQCFIDFGRFFLIAFSSKPVLFFTVTLILKRRSIFAEIWLSIFKTTHYLCLQNINDCISTVLQKVPFLVSVGVRGFLLQSNTVLSGQENLIRFFTVKPSFSICWWINFLLICCGKKILLKAGPKVLEVISQVPPPMFAMLVVA